jgi:hypothetical protein
MTIGSSVINDSSSSSSSSSADEYNHLVVTALRLCRLKFVVAVTVSDSMVTVTHCLTLNKQSLPTATNTLRLSTTTCCRYGVTLWSWLVKSYRICVHSYR